MKKKIKKIKQKRMSNLPCEVGKKCPYCGKICGPRHWMKHDPEGAEEEMFGDDWP